jgi:GNAT superfamily N-acetyltransferase
MRIIECPSLSPEQKAAVIKLWNEEYPVKLAYENADAFDQYLDGLSNKQHLLLLEEPDRMRGWALLFERDGATWFAIIVDSAMQGKGYGKLLLDTLKSKGHPLNGWVVDHDRDIRQNGKPYRSPLGFYLKHGFTTRPEVRLELEKLSAVKIEWEVR